MVQQAAAAGKQFDINSILGNVVDRGPWPYYDWSYLALATSTGVGTLNNSYTFFVKALNDTDPVTNATKTFTQTNMISSGNSYGFGSTRCYILEAFGFRFPTWLPKAAVDAIISCANFTFQIAEKPFWQGRLEDWPGGAGLSGWSTQGGEETWVNGIPAPYAMRRLTKMYSKYIAPTIPFVCQVNFPTSQAPTITVPIGSIPSGVGIVNGSNTCIPWLEWMLDGVTDRAVQ